MTWGMTCDEIERQLGIKAVDIMRWNDVGEDCSRMWAESHVCAGVFGEGPAFESSGGSADVLTSTAEEENPPITYSRPIAGTGILSSSFQTLPTTKTELSSISTTSSPESTGVEIVTVTSTRYLADFSDTITEPEKATKIGRAHV